jgi:hypothetical protein
MAILTSPVFKVSLSFRDLDKNVGSLTINVPVTTTIAEINTAVAALRTVVDGLSDAAFIGYNISYSAVETEPATPPEGSDVERKGSFTFRDGAGYPTTLQVPSIRNSLVINETQNINRAAAEVIAFEAAMTSAVLLTGRPTSAHGADLVSTMRAKKIHRGSSKG